MPGHEMSKQEVIDGRKAVADCLSRAGAVETQRQTTPEPQTPGLWFLPRPDPSGAAHPVHSLPILGSIAREPALVERFHEAPTAQEIRECFLKRHAMHEELLRADSGATLPMIWILAGARPSTAIEQFGFLPMAGEMAGVYSMAPGFRLGLVVLSELERKRDTLILRLLGAGRTFREALDDLQGLPADAWEAQLARPWLVRFQFELRGVDPGEWIPEEEAIMAAPKPYEDWERAVLERGKVMGRSEVLVTLCELRVGRPLREEERVKLAALLEAQGSARMAEAVLDTPAEELAAWIAGLKSVDAQR